MKGNKHWQTNGREKHRKYYRYIGSNILHSIDSSGILLGTWSPQQNLVFFRVTLVSGVQYIKYTNMNIFIHLYSTQKKLKTRVCTRIFFVNVSGLSILVCFRGREAEWVSTSETTPHEGFCTSLGFPEGDARHRHGCNVKAFSRKLRRFQRSPLRLYVGTSQDFVYIFFLEVYHWLEYCKTNCNHQHLQKRFFVTRWTNLSLI